MVMVKTTETNRGRHISRQLQNHLLLSGWVSLAECDTHELLSMIAPHMSVRVKVRNGKWVASAAGGYRAEADYLPDAICGLAIQLFNAGDVPR